MKDELAGEQVHVLLFEQLIKQLMMEKSESNKVALLFA